jgi:hypothetical protein
MRPYVLRIAALTAALWSAGVSSAPRAIAEELTSTKGPWETVRTDKGITVLRRTVMGTQLHEFQGTGIIEAPISHVMGVLQDTEHRREWMAESKEQRTVQQVNAKMVILYNRMGAPWPVKDRDSVMRAVTLFDTANKVVRVEIASTTHPDAPPVDGAVRMPFMVAHWYLWPQEGGKWTKAEYQVHADPGGSLPDWLINMVSKKIPHDTISALQQQVKRRQYPEFVARLEAQPDYQAIVRPVGAAPPPAAPAPSVPSPAAPSPARPAPAPAPR